MTIWDDRILEIARNDPDRMTKVSQLVDNDNIPISQSHISRRCQILAEHDLLRPRGDGVYLLTDRGMGYLQGEISTYVDEPDEIRDQKDDDEGDTGVPSPQSPG